MNGITVGRVFAIIGEIDRAFDLFGLVGMHYSHAQLEWHGHKLDLIARVLEEMHGPMRLDHELHKSFETEMTGIAEQYGINIFETV
jgi:hypothetical protein